LKFYLSNSIGVGVLWTSVLGICVTLETAIKQSNNQTIFPPITFVIPNTDFLSIDLLQVGI